MLIPFDSGEGTVTSVLIINPNDYFENCINLIK